MFFWLRQKLCDFIWWLERSQIRNTITSIEPPHGAQRLDHLELFEHEATVLQSHLRTIPYWVNGHYQLGQRALRLRQAPLAHACAQAVLQLEGPRSERGELLLAQALRHLGDEQAALSKLRELQSRNATNALVSEELGVILCARGDFNEALGVLTTIPDNRRSAEVCSAIVYLQGKVDN